jgi:hypothetical protein
MFCPLCRAEFDEPIACCPNCGATTVASEEEADRSVPRSELWLGDHPGICERLVQELAKAQINYFAEKRWEGMRYKWPMDAPRFRVYVLEPDMERATNVVKSVEGEFREDPSASIGVIGTIRRESAKTPQASDDWNPAGRGVEVWSGNDLELAEFLKESMRANEIGFCVSGDLGAQQNLEVRAEDASRAREIVREVMEGTPPE